jgi:capsular polysaccharide export protein
MALKHLAETGNLEAVFVWNGTDVVGQAIKDFVAKSGIPVLFWEFANLPAKLFVDPRGVNAQSSLAESDAVLDSYPTDVQAFHEWRAQYLITKLEQHSVPQAKFLKDVRYLNTGINWLGFRLLGIPTDDQTSLVKKFVWKVRRRKILPVETLDLAAEKYVFFPMQVSNDTQVLLNSDVDNEGAIRYAAKEAKRLGVRLLVKPHPAEPNVSFLNHILSLKDELHFSLMGDNTFQLARQAQLVITINSTVGLEALLLGKDLKFLGRSFYRYLRTDQRMAQYVMGYLLDIDYFGEEDVATAQVERLLNRLYDWHL